MPGIGPEQFDVTKYGVGGVFAVAISALVYFRRFMSKEATGIKGDRAERDMITRLSTLLADSDKRLQDSITAHQTAMGELDERLQTALARADQFAHERNEAIQLVGELKGQVQSLTSEVQRLRQAVEKSNGIQANHSGVQD